MQTMPSKNRTAVTLGAVILAFAVGAFLLWNVRNHKNAAPQTPEPTAMNGDQPLATAPGGTDTTVQAGGTTTVPATGSSTPTPPANMTTQIPATHKVAAGETLYDISRKYYNDPVYAGDIEHLNSLSDPDHLVVGQELKLPKWEDIHPAKATSTTVPATGN